MTDKSSLLSQSLSPDETSLRYMLKLAGPMIVTTISFTAMQFVDRFMVSRLGTTALAAILPAGFISFTNPDESFVNLIVQLLTVGEHQKREVSRYLPMCFSR